MGPCLTNRPGNKQTTLHIHWQQTREVPASIPPLKTFAWFSKSAISILIFSFIKISFFLVISYSSLKSVISLINFSSSSVSFFFVVSWKAEISYQIYTLVALFFSDLKYNNLELLAKVSSSTLFSASPNTGCDEQVYVFKDGGCHTISSMWRFYPYIFGRISEVEMLTFTIMLVSVNLLYNHTCYFVNITYSQAEEQ